jgi:hypothetical protein
MKIPKKIKIGGNWFKVIFKDTHRHEQKAHCGYENSDHCEITIDNALNIQTQETTFIHEILEVINYNNELELKHSQIMTLENNLYQVLKDNNLLK